MENLNKVSWHFSNKSDESDMSKYFELYRRHLFHVPYLVEQHSRARTSIWSFQIF